MSYAANHPIALQYAPHDRGGLELPHYYVTQGVTNVIQAIQHLRL